MVTTLPSIIKVRVWGHKFKMCWWWCFISQGEQVINVSTNLRLKGQGHMSAKYGKDAFVEPWLHQNGDLRQKALWRNVQHFLKSENQVKLWHGQTKVKSLVLNSSKYVMTEPWAINVCWESILIFLDYLYRNTKSTESQFALHIKGVLSISEKYQM